MSNEVNAAMSEEKILPSGRTGEYRPLFPNAPTERATLTGYPDTQKKFKVNGKGRFS